MDCMVLVGDLRPGVRGNGGRESGRECEGPRDGGEGGRRGNRESEGGRNESERAREGGREGEEGRKEGKRKQQWRGARMEEVR